jgi:DNA (cytosine-5)-methyltransferase 1
VPETEPVGHRVYERSKPDGISDRPETTSGELVPVLGAGGCDGMERKCVPHFPPTPGDLAQWREAFERRPELKPCLHRLDNGLAYGMDRTSAAGNGVVPLAAAHAFRTLKAELLDSR